MRKVSRTLAAAAFAAVLMMTAEGCKKKTPVATPPPPAPAAAPAEAPPPAPVAVRINSFTGEPRSIEPGQTTTYTLTAKGASGQDSRSVTIEVASSVPPP